MGKTVLVYGLVLAIVFWCQALYAEDCVRAIELYNQAVAVGSPAEKERLLRTALPLCTDSEVLSKVCNNLADVYEKDNRLCLALRYYRKALQFKPDLATASFSAADIFYALKDYHSAAAMYARGLRYAPSKEENERLSVCRELGKSHVVIYFERDSHTISEIYLDRLSVIGHTTGHEERILVAGHTCSLGSDQYNLELSLKRAKTVAVYLIGGCFIEPKWIEVTGKGESSPILSNDMPEGRKLNRRVEIWLQAEALSDIVHSR